jgi:2-oxoglutarate ferredoxin oxidoreductase subunit gamma
MNGPSLESFENSLVPSGTILVNSSLIEGKVKRTDLRVLYVPFTEIAKRAGLSAAAAVVALTIYAKASGAIETDTIKQVIPLSIKKKDLIDVNLLAVDAAAEYFDSNLSGSF